MIFILLQNIINKVEQIEEYEIFCYFSFSNKNTRKNWKRVTQKKMNILVSFVKVCNSLFWSETISVYDFLIYALFYNGIFLYLVKEIFLA